MTMAPIPPPPADLAERFQAMKRQEDAYKVLDYLNPANCAESAGLRGRTNKNMPAKTAAKLHLTEFPPAIARNNRQNNNCSSAGVSEEWRTKICEWLYQVIDHFDYDRDIVAVSFSYIDRYLSMRQTVSKRTFQLVAMTALYLACKLYGPDKIRMSSLLELGRGYFTEEHIEAMEMSILNKLGWQVHPPTPLTFARNYALVLEPTACEPDVFHNIMVITKFLTELSVVDYYFAPLKASSLGLAAILTAMEGISNGHLDMAEKQAFAINVYRVGNISPNGPEVMACRGRLRKMFYEGGYFEQLIPDEAALIAQEDRERSLATKRIANESPNAVDAHPIIQDEDATSLGTSSPVPAKNDNDSSPALESTTSSPSDVRTAITTDTDNNDGKVDLPWQVAKKRRMG